MSCIDHVDSCCPFAFTDKSEYVQGLGCLPTPFEIRNMRVFHNKTWACHSDPSTPCVGAIRWLKKNGLPYTVVDQELLTEQSNWHLYTNDATNY